MVFPERTLIGEVPRSGEDARLVQAVYVREDVHQRELGSVRLDAAGLFEQVKQLTFERNALQPDAARMAAWRGNMATLSVLMQGVQWSADPSEAATQLNALLDKWIADHP